LKPDETGWKVSVSKDDDMIQFNISGTTMPDKGLLARARDILNDFKSFKESVRKYLETESSEYPEDAQAEVASLKIDVICLNWPQRPNDGMIFFRGSESDIGYWHCDLIAGEPTGLACDT
jgi:hypothetical protein